MRSFLITFKPSSENSKSGWPIEEIRRLVRTCRTQGSVEEDWRFRSVKKVSVGDRIFLLLQGKRGPAIIGFGWAIGQPKNTEGVPRVPVRFESIVDPTADPTEALVTREELLRIGGSSSLWRTQASGVLIPEAIADKLDRLVLGAFWHGQDAEDEILEAPEGRLILRIHLSHERDRRLVEGKIRQALRKFGALCCEACGFNFVVKYGSRGSGFIECHHTKPVGELSAGDVTHIDDLALVCANCHRIIHRRRPWLTLQELRTLMTNS